MSEDANPIDTPFSGDFEEDIETAKRLIAAYPNVNLHQLMTIARDPQQPQSSRIASIYTLGFTDGHGVSKTILAGLASDPNESPDIRDHAAEALESVAGREGDRIAEREIDWTQCNIVERVPGRVSGAPVLRNTRLPVEAILCNYDAGLEPEEVAAIFEVAVADVRAILVFREKQLARGA